MDIINTADLKEQILSRYSELTSEIPSLTKRKTQALENFKQAGFPTTKEEEYKYTNFATALKKEYVFDTASSLNDQDLKKFLLPGLSGNVLIFINGRLSEKHSTILSSTHELEIKKFSEANQDELAEYFAKETYTSNDPFAELNTAVSSNGVFIRIKKGKALTHPVILYHISDSTTGNVFVQPRTLIVAEENSQCTIVESFSTNGTEVSFTNSVSEVVLKQDAIINHYKLQNDSPVSYHVGTSVYILKGKSIFNAATITLNGAIVRNNLHVILNAPYSEANFYGLYFLRDKQVVDNHTMVDHAVPNCQSNELYKGILADKSIGVFNGKIFVKQDAQKTNAFQSNRNVLLSKDAVMNTKPQLEIFADDVKCSHGATIGQLEEEPMFYLRSRGLSEESARSLLLLAFAQDIIDHLKVEPLQHFLSQAIEQRLGK